MRFLIPTFLAAAMPALAVAGTSCPTHFLGGVAPVITNPRMADGAIELCNNGYATLFSPASLDPIYSAEHLTRNRLEQAHVRKRHNAFHPDDRLPENIRTTLGDWKATGLCIDRGHMANDKDMASPDDEFESFALSNMVPQDTDNNEHLWEGIESTVRNMTLDEGEAYVVTGPVFKGRLVRLNGRMLVPTLLFKAFFIPATEQAGVYLTRNGAGDKYWSISLSQLRELTGIDIFPSLSKATKDAPMTTLPEPRPHFGAERNREASGACSPLAVNDAAGSGIRTPADATGPSHAADPPKSKSGWWRGFDWLRNYWKPR